MKARILIKKKNKIGIIKDIGQGKIEISAK